MLSIVPPPTDAQAETCHEYLGKARGFCPRQAHTHDDLGFPLCWPHAGERGIRA